MEQTNKLFIHNLKTNLSLVDLPKAVFLLKTVESITKISHCYNERK